MLRLVMPWHVRHMCVVVCHGKAVVIKHAPPIVGIESQLLHISFWMVCCIGICQAPIQQLQIVEDGHTIIAHPHSLVWPTNEQFLLALVMSSGSH